MLFARLLGEVIREGDLTVIDAGGAIHRIGRPGPRPAVTIRLHDRSLHYRLFFNPRLGIGEAFMDGSLTVENGTIYDFLDLIGLNTGSGTAGSFDRWVMRSRMLWRRVSLLNSPRSARRNVSHHYDLTGTLYDLFLDNDRQYSCAYFVTDNDSLEVAQDNKKLHLAAKLLLQPGQKVRDIGSGWGGLGLYLSRIADVDVTGVTLSVEQQKVSEERALQAGLGNRTRFLLRDYREVTGQFDRIVSVGMFEHVGLPQYETFFRKVSELLAEDGVALVHFICHMDPPYPTNPWLQKYIFPGGYSPALSEVLPAIERSGLWVTDIEVLRLHYAETLRQWRERFTANWTEAAKLYDERFCRMWEFYLAGCEMTFRRQGHMIAQIQLSKSVDAVPLTRDYIVDWERAHSHAPSQPKAAQAAYAK
ncbi:MAG: class I SAM-dependent methyltransferase [Dongiaceae bacterium]